VTAGVVELLDVERGLALFAQAITGAGYEVRPTDTFDGDGVVARRDAAMLSANVLYLPAQVATHTGRRMNRRAYRLFALHQLGYREFGTFAFRIVDAVQRSPALRARAPNVVPPRESDLDALYACFELTWLARLLFHLLEAHRIDSRMIAAYPGIRDDHRRETAAELSRRQPLAPIVDLRGVLEAVLHFTLGANVGPIRDGDATGVLESALQFAASVSHEGASVYATADAVVNIYGLLDDRGLLPDPNETSVATIDQTPVDRPAMHGVPPIEWLQREDRLEDWIEDLEGLDATIATSAVDAPSPGGDAGAERPPNIEVRRLTDERDTLARRIEIERNSIRHALDDAGASAGMSFLYDEWDSHAQRYLRGWCRLYERRSEPGDAQAVRELLRRIAPLEQRVRRQFHQLPLQAYQRTHRVLDGEELDWEAILDHHTDRRRGTAPDERVYQRRDRVIRDVAAAFLIDLSASTDDAIDQTETHANDPNDRPDDDDPLWHPVAIEAVPSRRIIDVLRDSIALMARALDIHGDSYGVFGFSGYGRDCVEYYVAKEFAEPLCGASLKALVGMRPRRSTRMGPAIRHSTAKLVRTGSAMKVLIMLSDGFPQDCDYGPDRSDHEYGVADTARALEEAARAGVETFCLTVDRSGHDYLKRMCPDDRYMLIEDIEALPDALSKVYQKLTA
jgi:hypothetical protein